jgi:hypothetical protein
MDRKKRLKIEVLERTILRLHGEKLINQGSASANCATNMTFIKRLPNKIIM